MLTKTKPFLLPTLGAIVLLIGGGATAYWLLVQRNLSEVNAPAQLIPQDALLTASISTDSEQWEQLSKYGTAETKAVLEQELTQLKDELLTTNGYNYEKDIQPWLGETAMIAYLSSVALPTDAGQAPPSGRSLQPDIIVLPIENPAQAKELLEKANSQKANRFVERSYQGIRIRETQKSNSRELSTAVLGRFLVVTNNPKTTERVIDTYKGAASVATTPGYIKELSKIRANKSFAQVYLNLPTFSTIAAANSTRAGLPNGTLRSHNENLAANQQWQGIAATVRLEPEGLHFQGISWLKPNSSQKNTVQNNTSRLPRRLPEDTWFMLSGSNLAQFWQDYTQGAESNPLTPIPPVNITAGLQATLGLDLEKDLLPWMGGEFSMALIPASGNPLTLPENQQSTQLGAGVVFMIQASDRKLAEKSLKQLDEVMATRYQFIVQETKLGSQPLVSWTSPLGGVSASHGWLEGNVVFLTLGAPIVEAIVPQPQATLIQNPLFQESVPTKPNPSNGQFFLDVEHTINSSNLNLPQLLSPEQKQLAKAIRAIGVTTAVNDERSNRFDLFIQLQKAPKPTPPAPSASPTPPTPLTSPTPPMRSASPTPSTSRTPSAPLASPTSPTPSTRSASPTPSTSRTPSASPAPPTPSVSPSPSASSSIEPERDRNR
ncbi:MAG: DUF3352 domain-containing protein [Microcoleus sp. SIO2G3]|nr:DUF3352 domain-containing protein [Microcoleus sp. SIO2G3]